MASACLLGGLLTSPAAMALTETEGYTEKFENLGDVSASPDFAPSYWLHFVDGNNVNTPWYEAAATGGHDDGAYVKTTSKCNPYYMSYDGLVTPPVKGNVTFYVKGQVLELYTMTFDGTAPKRGSSISLPSGFSIKADEWQQVSLEFSDYTRVGIVVRATYNGIEGGIDDFAADFADLDPITMVSVTNVQYDSKAVADVDGNATMNVSFTFSNKGTTDVDLSAVSFTAGKADYMGESLTETYGEPLTLSGTLAPGESTEVEMAVPYTLADPSKTESVILSVRCDLTGGITRVGSISVQSLAGVLVVKNGTSTLSAGGVVECDAQRGAYECQLLASNTGNSEISIVDVFFDGNLEGEVEINLPIVINPEESGIVLPFQFSGNPGGYSGLVTLVYSDGVSEDKEFEFTLSAGIVTEDGFLVDFQDKQCPKGWLNGFDGSNSFNFNSYPGSYDPKVRANSASYGVSKLVTSLMKLDNNGTLTVMGGRQSLTKNGSDDNVLLIYYSTDRKNWQTIGGIVASEPSGRLPFNTFVASQTKDEMLWYNFSLKNIESGEYYLMFEAMPFSIDNIFGIEPAVPAHDMMVNSISAPATGEVNKLLTAKVTVTNMKNEAESDYVVTLFDGDTAVAEAEGVELSAYGSATIELSFMPRTAGDRNLYAEVNVADNFAVLESPEVTVAVAVEECAGKDTTASIDSFSTSALTEYKENKVQFYIPAEAISLAEGTEISEIAFTAYNSSSYSDCTIPYTLWVENVDEAVAFIEDDKVDFELPEAEANAEGTYVFAAGSGSQNDPADVILALTNPVVYNGKALKVTIEINLSSTLYSFYVGVHKYDVNYKRGYGFTSSYLSGPKLYTEVPVVTLRYALEPAAVTGRITSKDGGVENAVVTLTEGTPKFEEARAAVDSNSALVAYSATTDADGYYEIPVIKSDRDYVLSVSYNGEVKHVRTTSVSFNGEDVAIEDIEIDTSSVEDAVVGACHISVSGTSVSVYGANADVYTVTGILVGRVADGASLSLASGVYVVRFEGATHANKIIVK